ncbi:uncharacterized protein LOC144703182 [Wolffia australiana]
MVQSCGQPRRRVRILSERVIRPSVTEYPRRCELSLWDLSMLSLRYIQKGLLFSVPYSTPIETIVDRLTSSLQIVLSHFRPVAGRLVVDSVDDDGGGITVYIACDDRGAALRLAAVDGVQVADVLAASDDVPSFVRDLFPYDGAVNYDGVSLHLLAVQLTKLEDGVFLGCSFNHLVGDGTAFWNFFNAWAEISRSPTPHLQLCSAPVLERWFPDGSRPPIRFPFTDEDQFIERFSPPPLREKFFHFTGAAIARLKAEANEELGTGKISSFQALSACMWRCITRARRLPKDETVVCSLAAENRKRLRPPLPETYLGNSLNAVSASATAGEIITRGIGWAAGMINESVARHTDVAIRETVEKWMKAPVVYRPVMERFCVFIGSSPRFNMYGCDFGWGKAVAVRSGSANKFDGKISAYPGRDGNGSIDLEVCLSPEIMTALESDAEFNRVVFNK